MKRINEGVKEEIFLQPKTLSLFLKRILHEPVKIISSLLSPFSSSVETLRKIIVTKIYFFSNLSVIFQDALSKLLLTTKEGE